MPSLTLHKVSSPQEWEHYSAIRRKIFIEEQSRTEEVEFDSFDETSEHFLALLGGKFIGTARLRFDDPAQCYTIERMAISAPYRRKGHGRTFFNLLIQVVKNKNSTRLILHTGSKTLDFYRSMGCRLTGISFPDNPVPCLEMELKL